MSDKCRHQNLYWTNLGPGKLTFGPYRTVCRDCGKEMEAVAGTNARKVRLKLVEPEK